MLLTTIVTRLPPAIDGVGDYALHLACRLRQDFGLETHFIVGDPKWFGATQIEEFPITPVSVCSANALLSVLPSESSAPILLHYVGYGYAKRGCPIWLVDGLQRWLTKGDNRALVTLFHEIYATGPPWASSFWLSPLQKNLVARLVQLSDRYLTSRQGYAERLYELSRDKNIQIPTLPVFSNIGEPEQVAPLAERQRRIVVFGSPSNRRRVYQESLAELELTCQLLEIEEIWDIGASANLTLSTVNGVPVVGLGERSAAEISDILLNSFAGFFNYTPAFLAKSGVFAAYCAHGLLPVSHVSSASTADGIIDGKHYWIGGNNTEDSNALDELQAIADNAHAWYHTHNLSVHATTFAAVLRNAR